MSERKVLNKYYPPDFDPTKIPRVKQEKNRQFTVRLMAPFNMRCKTCGEYIYKGKKFNARKEDVENETYYGVRIYRFYIKCTRCLSEISFKTDPASTDYVIEAGATRNFMALKLAEEAALREIEDEKEEERTNPMKLLENRTKASRKEIETVEALEELKELNQRKVAVNYEEILQGFQPEAPVDYKTQELEDEEFIKSVFGEKTEDGKIIKRLADSDSDEDGISRPVKIAKPSASVSKPVKATDFLAEATVSLKASKSSKFGNLVKVKKAEPVSKPTERKVDVKPHIKQETETEILAEFKIEREFKPEVKIEKDNAIPKTGGLSLLGAYSDSDSNDSS